MIVSNCAITAILGVFLFAQSYNIISLIIDLHTNTIPIPISNYGCLNSSHEFPV